MGGGAGIRQPGDIIVGAGHTYLVERVLGQGGMGIVYSVRDRNIHQRCALKVLLREHVLERSSLVERFDREARIPGFVRHENVVRVLHLGRLDDALATPFYVMELYEAHSLKVYLRAIRENARRRGTPAWMPLDQALNLVIEMLFGLERVHEFGIIHRDLKPDNILLHRLAGGGLRPVTIDFGIAHLVSDGPYAGIAGSACYAAPEQLTTGIVDKGADVFAVGVLLFELIAGVRPYDHVGTDWAAAETRATLAAPSVEEYRPELPRALVDLVRDCLSLDPAERPTVAALIPKLQAISNALPLEDPAVAVTAEDWRAQRNRTQPHALTQVDLGAPTDPIGDAPEIARMRYEIERASAAAKAARQDTTPMAAPPSFSALPDPRPMLIGAGFALLPPRDEPAVHHDAVTKPPSPRRHETQPMHGQVAPGSIQYVDSVRPPPTMDEINALLAGLAAAARARVEEQHRLASRGGAVDSFAAVGGTVGGAAIKAEARPALVEVAHEPRRDGASKPIAAGRRSSSAPMRRSKLVVFGVTLLVVVGTGLSALVWTSRTNDVRSRPSAGSRP